MSEAVELEPCPFCGGAAVLNDYTTAPAAAWVLVHRASDCFLAPAIQNFPTKEAAIAAWNRRSLTGEGEPVATDAEFFDAVVGWLSARDMIDRQDALDGLTVADVIAALDEHENGMATAYTRPVAWRYLFGSSPDGCWSYAATSPHPEWAEQCRQVQPLYTRPVACPDREAIRRTLYPHVYPNSSTLVAYDQLPDAPYLDAAADAIMALLSASGGGE